MLSQQLSSCTFYGIKITEDVPKKLLPKKDGKVYKNNLLIDMFIRPTAFQNYNRGHCSVYDCSCLLIQYIEPIVMLLPKFKSLRLAPIISVSDYVLLIALYAFIDYLFSTIYSIMI